MVYTNEIHQGLRDFYPAMQVEELEFLSIQMDTIIPLISQYCNISDELMNNNRDQDIILMERLTYNNYQDLRDLSTMWYPYISSEDRQKLTTWDDILKYSNIKYNKIDVFNKQNIQNQTDAIRTTIENYGNWFLPNWIDIYPDDVEIPMDIQDKINEIRNICF